jgi:transcription antitermination factor NusG
MPKFEKGDIVKVIGGPEEFVGITGIVKSAREEYAYPYLVEFIGQGDIISGVYTEDELETVSE